MTRKQLSLQALAALSIICVGALGTAAHAGGHKSSSDVFWMWDNPMTAAPVGTSSLVRTGNGLNARFQTTGLQAGHTVTLWIMFFNNPEECSPAYLPCAANPANIFNPATGFDFHYAGGHIVNEYRTTIAGHLPTGEDSTSGGAALASLGLPAATVPLMNPMGAEVILAIHSHGPAGTGQLLKEQTSSYLGGCDIDLANDSLFTVGDPMTGFARGSFDIPAIPGECSTIQQSLHLP